MRTLTVSVSHDPKANLWTVDKSDIPGLNVEANSLDQLVEVVMDAAPDLIAFNMGGENVGASPIDIQFTATAKAMLSPA